MSSNLWKECTDSWPQHICGSDQNLWGESDVNNSLGRLVGAQELRVHVGGLARQRAVRWEGPVNQVIHVDVTWKVSFYLHKDLDQAYPS